MTYDIKGILKICCELVKLLSDYHNSVKGTGAVSVKSLSLLESINDKMAELNSKSTYNDYYNTDKTLEDYLRINKD